MKTYLASFFQAFRVAAATLGLFGAVELTGLWLLHEPIIFTRFLTATLTALFLAAALALLLAAIASVLKPLEPLITRLSSFAATGLIWYLLSALYLEESVFHGRPRWMHLAALLGLAALMALFGRVVWVYVNRGDAPLSDTWFQGLAPISGLCGGVVAAVQTSLDSRPMIALIALLVLGFMAAGQYFLMRFLWARRRKRFSRWAKRIHLATAIAVPLAAVAGVAIQDRLDRRPPSGPADATPTILITIDTLRRDHVSAFNPNAAPTPVMDALAADGIVFQNAVSPSTWTPPAMGAVMTGLGPSACNAGTLDPRLTSFVYTGPLLSAKTLGEAFQEAGYFTAGFCANPWIIPAKGIDGFDRFELFQDEKYQARFVFERALNLVLIPLRLTRLTIGAPSTLTAQVIDWLERRPNGPFFLWVHYITPHQPYRAHPEFPTKTVAGPMADTLANDYYSWRVRAGIFNMNELDRQFIRERYLGEVLYQDLELKPLIEYLKKHGLYDRSVIALTSDHGEELWDHGDFEHGHAFWREIVDVPLIVKLPGQKSKGAIVPRWVSTVRLGATLLEAAGAKASFPRASLLAELGGNGPTEDDPQDFFWFSERVFYRTDRGAIGDGVGIKAYLKEKEIVCYNLNIDPAELDPIPEARCPWPYGRTPRQLFEDFQAANRKTFLELGGDKAGPEDVNHYDLRMLKNLGYINVP